MKKFIFVMIGAIALLSTKKTKADEGMWIPALLTDNYAEMKRLGLELTPEQIYSVNNSSLKDAIVRLGRGFCTGEIISDQGLILTNHHCGYSAIQKLSTTTANHLRDGFWAKDKSEEKPAGFSVAFLVKIEDITDKVLDGVAEEDDYATRSKKVAENSGTIRKEMAEEKYDVDIKSMFSGNKYFAYVYETFNDVRLVGTPPESVGKYGGDTDNWMWPRHTGDFSMFRVYANKNNEAAEYSEDNVPYKPKHHLPVSLKGVDEGDYAMIFGFPGSTDRYLTSYGVKLATEKDQPSRVKLRRAKLDVYEKYQNKDEAVDLMYAAKHAQVSNYWKYFIGQTKGLKKLGVYDKKKAEEDAFEKWAKQDEAKSDKYGGVMKMYQEAYAIFEDKTLAQTYFGEAIAGIESLSYGFGYTRLLGLYKSKKGVKDAEKLAAIDKQIEDIIDGMKKGVQGHFKDYYSPIDAEVAEKMFQYYIDDIPAEQRPNDFNAFYTKNKKSVSRMVDRLFAKSFLVSADRTEAFLANPSEKKLAKDPGVQLSQIFLNYYYTDMRAMFGNANEKRQTADRLYKAALMEMHPDKKMYPNANSSMRVTYGQVLPYSPGDAMFYKHFTTMPGVLEKYQPGDHEFDLPEKYLEVARDKDYGRYAKEGEELRVCFLSNNDITGGNSGSPVINGKGELIGLAFDGNWEAMSGDIAFEQKLQRTISVDIRYVLWCIDKLAGAGHIVDEMTLVTK